MSGSPLTSPTAHWPRRRQEKTEFGCHFFLCYLCSAPLHLSPVLVIMKHSTNELNNFLYRDGRQDKREKQIIRDIQHYIGLGWDPGHDRSKYAGEWYVDTRWRQSVLKSDVNIMQIFDCISVFFKWQGLSPGRREVLALMLEIITLTLSDHEKYQWL